MSCIVYFCELNVLNFKPFKNTCRYLLFNYELTINNTVL